MLFFQLFVFFNNFFGLSFMVLDNIGGIIFSIILLVLIIFLLIMTNCHYIKAFYILYLVRLIKIKIFFKNYIK